MNKPVVPAGSLVLPKNPASGIKRGTTHTNDFGWHDLIGAVQPKTTGADAPSPNKSPGFYD